MAKLASPFSHPCIFMLILLMHFKGQNSVLAPAETIMLEACEIIEALKHEDHNNNHTTYQSTQLSTITMLNYAPTVAGKPLIEAGKDIEDLLRICNISVNELNSIYSRLHQNTHTISLLNNTSHNRYSDFFVALRTLLDKAVKLNHEPEIENQILERESLNLFKVIANSTSVIFLLLLLLTFQLFKELRTLPGQYMIYLGVFLLLGHSLILLSIHAGNERKFCSVVGILTHWVYLTVFSLTLVIASDLLRMFGFSVKHGPVSKSRHRNALTVAFCTPVLVVTPCVIVNFVDDRNDIYGSGGVCFVTNLWANLFAFEIPVILALIFSTVCIIIATMTIYRAQTQSKRTLGTNMWKVRFRIIMLILKLATITGFGWILGFVASQCDSRVLIWLFEILSSLQGTMVFIGFVCSKRVVNLYKRRFMKRYYEFQSRQRTSK